MASLLRLSYDNSYHLFSYQGFPVIVREFGRHHGGIPLVIVGGAFQGIQQLEKISTAIAQKNRVLAIDTPGNGETGVLPHSFGFDFLCRSIHSVLREMGIERVSMLGGSYGSIVAMRYAQTFPGVQALVLMAAMEQLPPHLRAEFDLLLGLLDAGRTDIFSDRFTNLMTNADLRENNKICRVTAERLHHALRTASPGICAQFCENTRRILWDGNTDTSRMPDVPTTVFAGTYDQFIPVEANKRIAAAFRRGRFIEIPEADHMVHVEKFRTVVEIVLGAIQGGAAAPAPQAGPAYDFGAGDLEPAPAC